MSKTQLIASRRKLAKAIGRSETTTRKHLRDDRWPFSRKPPWPQSDVAKIQRWMLTTLAQDPNEANARHIAEPRTVRADANPADPQTVADADKMLDGPLLKGMGAERIARLKLIVARIAKLDAERQIRLGLYLPKADVEFDMLRKIQYTKSALLAMGRVLSHRPVNIPDAEQVEAIITAEVEAVLIQFAGGREAYAAAK